MVSPLISIIIPTFNRAMIIGDTLDSIILQSYKYWECIIIDDGSTDETISVINQYINKDCRFCLLKRPVEKHKGANACRNVGLNHSSGEFIIFFDSDDLMDVSCLDNRVNSFMKNRDYDFLVFSMGLFVDKSNCYIDANRKYVNTSNKITIEEFIFSRKLPWNVCRPIFKSDLIKNNIFFNEIIQNFHDDEFNLRVLYYLKPNYLSIDNTDCYYRFNADSVNKYNNLQGNQNIVNALVEYYKTVFIVLDKDSKTEYRDKLIQKLYNQIKSYVKPEVNTSAINKTIKLFDNEVNLSIKEYCVLHAIKLLNNYFLYTKGYYFVASNIKKIIFKN